MQTTTVSHGTSALSDRELFARFEAIRGCRHHFPLLRQRVNGKPLVYFDNAATSQKRFQNRRGLSQFCRVCGAKWDCPRVLGGFVRVP